MLGKGPKLLITKVYFPLKLIFNIHANIAVNFNKLREYLPDKPDTLVFKYLADVNKESVNSFRAECQFVVLSYCVHT